MVNQKISDDLKECALSLWDRGWELEDIIDAILISCATQKSQGGWTCSEDSSKIALKRDEELQVQWREMQHDPRMQGDGSGLSDIGIKCKYSKT